MLGLQDSVNPCALVTFAIFLFFLLRWGKTQKYIFRLGMCFIGSVFLTEFLFSLSTFDFFLNNAMAARIFSILYFLIAIFLLGLGTAAVIDWVRERKGFVSGKFAPAFWKDSKEEEPLRKGFRVSKGFRLAVGAFFLAFVLTIMASFWPQNYYLFILFYYLLTQGQFAVTLLSFACYSLGYVAPLLILWIILLEISKRKEPKQRSLWQSPLVLGSVYLSIGLGLILVLAKNLK